LKNSYEVTVLDNLSNSSFESLRRVQEMTGRSLTFHQVDLQDAAGLEKVFASQPFEAVIHFAALKAPGESVEQPLRYYQNNITGTLNLIEAMQQHRVKNIIFSSSATVYGFNETMPLREEFPTHTQANPYGRTKRMMEMILEDIQAADPAWNVALLRYFNPVGAHESGRIGEDPRGVPNNLMPFITQVAVGRREKLGIFGDDYPTPDGTCIRDYVHVVDIAVAHVKSLDKLAQNPGLVVYNLSTNRGTSVIEMVQAFEKATGKRIPYQIMPRRPGDLPMSYADAGKANRELGWQAKRSVEQMCADAWRWQEQNPHGYAD
jgi:UDP-glucose 4-epimerase